MDYKFYSTAKVDDCFQFVDCCNVNIADLVKDIHSGVVPIANRRVVIALGNSAKLDEFMNVTTIANAIINALVERFGCVGREIVVLSLFPHPLADPFQTQIIQRINKSLFKSVRALVRRKKFPIRFIAGHKWLLKRVKSPDGIRTDVDNIYYVPGTNNLNEHGLAHLHLLLAQELKLRWIKYKWNGMPVVEQRACRKVLREVQQTGEGETQSFQEVPSWEDSSCGSCMSSSDGSEPPLLVPLENN